MLTFIYTINYQNRLIYAVLTSGFSLVFVVCLLFKDLKKDDLELNIVRKVTPQNKLTQLKLANK